MEKKQDIFQTVIHPDFPAGKTRTLFTPARRALAFYYRLLSPSVLKNSTYEALLHNYLKRLMLTGSEKRIEWGINNLFEFFILPQPEEPGFPPKKPLSIYKENQPGNKLHNEINDAASTDTTERNAIFNIRALMSPVKNNNWDSVLLNTQHSLRPNYSFKGAVVRVNQEIHKNTFLPFWGRKGFPRDSVLHFLLPERNILPGGEQDAGTVEMPDKTKHDTLKEYTPRDREMPIPRHLPLSFTFHRIIHKRTSNILKEIREKLIIPGITGKTHLTAGPGTDQVRGNFIPLHLYQFPYKIPVQPYTVSPEPALFDGQEDITKTGGEKDRGDESQSFAALSPGEPLGIIPGLKMRTIFPDLSFSTIRIHSDSSSDRASKTLGAEAFSLGRDIFFRTGSFNPASVKGLALLAHELVHVHQAEKQSGALSSFNQEELEQDALDVEKTILGRRAKTFPGRVVGFSFPPVFRELPSPVSFPGSQKGASMGTPGGMTTGTPSGYTTPMKAEEDRITSETITPSAAEEEAGDFEDLSRRMLRYLNRQITIEKERRGVDRW
jgi:hypothetical protein